MAIDYGKEWKKLMKEHGKKGIQEFSVAIKLGTLMRNQIHNTIDKREKLMREYLKVGMGTDITSGDKVCHYVHVVFRKHIFGTVAVSKKDFAAWCEKKGGR